MFAAVLPNVVWRIAFPCCITEEGVLGVLQLYEFNAHCNLILETLLFLGTFSG